MSQHDASNIINKVVYDGDVLIDLTGDTITAVDVINGKTFHLASGAVATGTCNYDADTTDATANAAEILSGKTAYKNGSKITGTMANKAGTNVTVSGLSGTVISSGFYDGSGKAVIDSTSAANLVASNIRDGVTILGVEGTLSAEDELQVGPATATPTTAQQIITAASLSFDYITQVTVNAIPYNETQNAAGGYTATIAGA